MDKNRITVQTTINKPIQDVWKCWTTAADIEKWNAASNDWHTTNVKNELKVGGNFSYRMEAKDGSVGFNFDGTYSKVIENKTIEYTMADGREATVIFMELNNKTKLVETFEAENENSIELQRKGWQAILDNFKKHIKHNTNSNLL